MNLAKQVKLFDIEYYEGPMLSLFRDDKVDNFYLYKWLDVDKTGHKWLIFKTNLDNLYDYLHQNIDEKTLVENASDGRYTIAVIQSDLTFGGIEQFTNVSLPTQFSPSIGCFFTSSDCPDYEKVVAFFDNISILSLQVASKAA